MSDLITPLRALEESSRAAAAVQTAAGAIATLAEVAQDDVQGYPWTLLSAMQEAHERMKASLEKWRDSVFAAESAYRGEDRLVIDEATGGPAPGLRVQAECRPKGVKP